MSAPRRPAGPRTPAGARSAGRARSARRTTASARAAAGRSRATALAEDPGEPAAGPFEGLSGLQLLLAEFNAFLRDPTLTRALTKLARNLSAAMRELARALARLLRLAWLRYVLLGLLALALPLALLSLLGSSDRERAAAGRGGEPAAASGGFQIPSLPGVAMPELRTLSARPRPVNVALVADGTYSPPALRRELRTLRAWLSANHAPGTRVSVIDARAARRPAAVRSAFGRQDGRRLLVTVGSATAPAGNARRLRVATRRGGAGSVTSAPGARRARVTIDDRRPNALAASMARAIMSISGQRERP